MTEQIKDPRTSWEIYGYTTDPTNNKQEVVLYGMEFKLDQLNKTITIERCLVSQDILKHFKVKREDSEQISNPPLFTLTTEQYYVEDLRGSIINGRYELTNCKIKIHKVSLMPGRRVIAYDVTCTYDEMIYYKESVETFIDEILAIN